MAEPRSHLARFDRLRDRLSLALHNLALRVEAPDRTAHLPRCPDCQIGPDVGDNCPVCEDMYRQQKAEEAIYADGYGDAMLEMTQEDRW